MLPLLPIAAGVALFDIAASALSDSSSPPEAPSAPSQAEVPEAPAGLQAGPQFRAAAPDEQISNLVV